MQVRQGPSTPPEETNHEALEDALSSPIAESISSASHSPVTGFPTLRPQAKSQPTKPKASWKEPQVATTLAHCLRLPKLHYLLQPFEVLRAVERKDIAYLMEIRDRAFHVCYTPFISVPCY